MKELTILHNGIEHKLQYKVFGSSDYDGEFLHTDFYRGVEITQYKKYWLWGEMLTKTEPKLVFTLWFNIELPSYTKAEIKAFIVHRLEILGRQEEINRGELI